MARPRTVRWGLGGGRVSLYADVGRGVFIDSDSSVSGDAQVGGGVHLHNSEVRGGVLYGDIVVEDSIIEASGAGPVIFGQGRILRSKIGGAPRIFMDGAVIRNSVVDYCAELRGSFHVENSEVGGTALVADRASVFDMALGSDEEIYGSATLIGPFELPREIRIHEGRWTRAPRLIGEGEFTMTECVEGRMLLGCTCEPLSWWREHARGMARIYGWTKSEADEYVRLSEGFDKRDE